MKMQYKCSSITTFSNQKQEIERQTSERKRKWKQEDFTITSGMKAQAGTLQLGVKSYVGLTSWGISNQKHLFLILTR